LTQLTPVWGLDSITAGALTDQASHPSCFLEGICFKPPLDFGKKIRRGASLLGQLAAAVVACPYPMEECEFLRGSVRSSR